MMKYEFVKALRNYGYRYVGKSGKCYTFGKPLGYGVLRADFEAKKSVVEVMLIVKGCGDGNKRTNLLWSKVRKTAYENTYLGLVQAVADCEAEIFLKMPVASGQNRDIRYDFEENPNVDFDE